MHAENIETPWVNFINILRKAFTSSDPKSAKKTFSLTVFFGLLGYECIKASSRTLIKLTSERSLSKKAILRAR